MAAAQIMTVVQVQAAIPLIMIRMAEGVPVAVGLLAAGKIHLMYLIIKLDNIKG